MTSVERTSLERLDNSTSSFSLPEDIDVSQEYSDAPKSGRPVFGVFENCPVIEQCLITGQLCPVSGCLVG